MGICNNCGSMYDEEVCPYCTPDKKTTIFGLESHFTLGLQHNQVVSYMPRLFESRVGYRPNN